MWSESSLEKIYLNDHFFFFFMFQHSLAYHTCINIKQERAMKIKFVLIRKFECSFFNVMLQLYVIGGLAEMASFDNCISSLPTIHVHKQSVCNLSMLRMLAKYIFC